MLLPELNLPIGFAGKDGFYWWIGQVEDKPDPKNSNRYKVRIIGQHVKSCTAVPVEDLPWAVCMFPVTHPSTPGNASYTPTRLLPGTWVIGFFMDGSYGQQPVIMGTIGKVANSDLNTSYSNDPNSEGCLAFKRYIPTTNPNLTGASLTNADLVPGKGNGSSGNAVAAIPASTADAHYESPAGHSGCNLLADAQCEDPKEKNSAFEQTLTELFGNIQKTNGQIGTQLVSDVTGKLSDYSIAANGYISRLFGLSNAYITAGKFQMFSVLKEGVKDIVSFLLAIPAPTKKEGTAVVQTKTGYLGSLTKEINKILGEINCAIEDLEKLFLDFLTELIYDLITTAVSAATCTLEALISQILSELESFFASAIEAIFGPLQILLDIIASPLNLIGSILDYIFDLFGITCTGSTGNCSSEEDKKICWGKNKPGEKDFATLDDIIENIEAAGTEELQTTCEESQYLPCPAETSATVFTGEPDPDQFTGPPEVVLDPPTDSDFDNYFDFDLPEDEIEEEEEVEDFPISVDENVSNVVPGNVGGSSPSSTTINGVNDYYYPSNSSDPTVAVDFSSQIQYSPSFATVDVRLSYSITANKSEVSNGETIQFVLTCVDGVVEDGTVFNYLMYGAIKPSDFADGTNIGSMTMKNNIAVKNISLSEDLSVADRAVVLFSVAQAAVGVNFTIVNKKYVAPDPTPPQPTFKKPELGTPEVDDDGKVIFIPINNPGDPYKFPPAIQITGAGLGAVASAVLDGSGRLTNVLIQRPGTGYTPNKNPKTRCVIDKFIMIRPGLNYRTEPVVLVNGEEGIAKAIIDDRGFVVNIQVINKTKTFSKFPSVTITGGGGAGAIALPSLSCLNDKQFTSYVSDVAPFGTDNVIDCP